MLPLLVVAFVVILIYLLYRRRLYKLLRNKHTNNRELQNMLNGVTMQDIAERFTLLRC